MPSKPAPAGYLIADRRSRRFAQVHFSHVYLSKDCRATTDLGMGEYLTSELGADNAVC